LTVRTRLAQPGTIFYITTNTKQALQENLKMI
jgi:hypothetical protein